MDVDLTEQLREAKEKYERRVQEAAEAAAAATARREADVTPSSGEVRRWQRSGRYSRKVSIDSQDRCLASHWPQDPLLTLHKMRCLVNGCCIRQCNSLALFKSTQRCTNKRPLTVALHLFPGSAVFIIISVSTACHQPLAL